MKNRYNHRLTLLILSLCSSLFMSTETCNPCISNPESEVSDSEWLSIDELRHLDWQSLVSAIVSGDPKKLTDTFEEIEDLSSPEYVASVLGYKAPEGNNTLLHYVYATAFILLLNNVDRTEKDKTLTILKILIEKILEYKEFYRGKNLFLAMMSPNDLGLTPIMFAALHNLHQELGYLLSEAFKNFSKEEFIEILTKKNQIDHKTTALSLVVSRKHKESKDVLIDYYGACKIPVPSLKP